MLTFSFAGKLWLGFQIKGLSVGFLCVKTREMKQRDDVLVSFFHWSNSNDLICNKSVQRWKTKSNFISLTSADETRMSGRFTAFQTTNLQSSSGFSACRTAFSSHSPSNLLNKLRSSEKTCGCSPIRIAVHQTAVYWCVSEWSNGYLWTMFSRFKIQICPEFKHHTPYFFFTASTDVWSSCDCSRKWNSSWITKQRKRRVREMKVLGGKAVLCRASPFFSEVDMNMTAMSKRLTLARLLRVSSVTAGGSFLPKSFSQSVSQHNGNRTHMTGNTCDHTRRPWQTPKTMFEIRKKTIKKSKWHRKLHAWSWTKSGIQTKK